MGLTLRRINNGLTAVVIALCLYIIAFPFIPNLTFFWKTHFGSKPALVLANSQDKQNQQTPEVIPDTNTLVIPKLAMQETINEGQTIAALRHGVWRRPNTSTPDQGSNTVIVGHRFTYSGEAVFYHLDKLHEGDEIVVYWNKKKIVYRVNRVQVVPANYIEVEKLTDNDVLTLYTCTPLLTAKDRLVVQAEPIEEER